MYIILVTIANWTYAKEDFYEIINSCRFKKFCSLLTVMLLMLFSVIPASAAELSTDEKAEVLVGTEYAIEIPSSMADNTVAISVDDIMEHSTVTTYGASMEGSYESEKYDAGLPGYTFQIIFDWKAAVNSSGDYIFDKITNAKVTTYKNDIICAMTWGYSSYKVTKNTYSISSNKKSITFNTTYDFEYIMKDDPLAHIYNSTESHTYTIQLNDII